MTKKQEQAQRQVVAHKSTEKQGHQVEAQTPAKRPPAGRRHNMSLQETRQWAYAAAQAALEKKATDVVLINVQSALVIVDYFVVASADNPRQLRAVVDIIEERLLKDWKLKPLGREGLEQLEWVLLDYGDFVVHVFLPTVRAFYRLETLYNDAEQERVEEQFD